MISFTLDGMDMMSLVTFAENGRYGRVRSLAVQDDYITIIGDKGLRMYHTALKPMQTTYLDKSSEGQNVLV